MAAFARSTLGGVRRYVQPLAPVRAQEWAGENFVIRYLVRIEVAVARDCDRPLEQAVRGSADA